MTQAPPSSPDPIVGVPLAPALAADHVYAQHPPARRAQIERMRLVNAALLLALIALGVSWELWLAPLKGGSGGLLAAKVLPLTLAIAGTLKHKLYTYRWMSLLIWLYFTEGVMRATSDTGLSQVLAGIEVALSIALFAAGSVYVRLRLRVMTPEDKKAAKAARALEH
jgi:uncharacterized membrane protein